MTVIAPNPVHHFSPELDVFENTDVSFVLSALELMILRLIVGTRRSFTRPSTKYTSKIYRRSKLSIAAVTKLARNVIHSIDLTRFILISHLGTMLFRRQEIL